MTPGDRAGPDAERVLEALRRVRDRPPPGDPSSAGCSTAVVAIVTLVLMPFIGRALDLSGNAMAAAGLALLVVALAGIGLDLSAGGRARRAIAAAIDSAVQEIAAGAQAGEIERVEEGAVRLLELARVEAGPATVPTFAAAEVAALIGDALPAVIEVERILIERGGIDPVFTDRS